MTIQGQLTGTKVEIVLSDPWDFVTRNPAGPFAATVVRESHDQQTSDMSLLIELDKPLHCERQECKYIVGATRHEGKLIEEIFSGESVSCNFTCIPEEKVKSANPFDLSWWRGGGAFIADLRLLE